MKILFYSLLTVLVAFSCVGLKNKSKKRSNAKIPKAIVVDNMHEYRNNTPTDIMSATISDSILTLKVSYDGGCENHDFSLYGSKMIMKSMPAIRGIVLFHNNNNDDCREKIEEELKFNIIDFKYPNSDIMLALDNYDSKIRFSDPLIKKDE